MWKVFKLKFAATLILSFLTFASYGQSKARSTNGFNFSWFSQHKKVNGISFGIIVAEDSIVNGLQFGALWSSSRQINGLTLGGLTSGGVKLNGVAIGGLSVCGDTLNGLVISGLGNMWWNTETIELINGISIGGLIGSDTRKLNGLSIGLILNNIGVQNGITIAAFNKTKELHGIQFGLLNYAGNNRPMFRWTPVFNFNFRKRQVKPDI